SPAPTPPTTLMTLDSQNRWVQTYTRGPTWDVSDVWVGHPSVFAPTGFDSPNPSEVRIAGSAHAIYVNISFCQQAASCGGFQPIISKPKSSGFLSFSEKHGLHPCFLPIKLFTMHRIDLYGACRCAARGNSSYG